MNHPARLSRKRGTAAACLAGASRRDTALRRPGLGRQPRRGGAGCRGGTARCLPAPPGAERSGDSGAASAGAGAGSAAGSAPWGWCPNSFNHGSSSESFPLRPLLFFLSLSLFIYFFFFPRGSLHKSVVRTKSAAAAAGGAPGERRQQAGGSSPLPRPGGALRRAARGEASGLRPEVNNNKKGLEQR